jgi:sialate O-acetylesterase
MTVEGNKIRLTFTNTGSGLVMGTSPYIPPGTTPKTSAKLTGFSIAGTDQKFVWAGAVIDGNSIVVSSDQVPSPIAVCYDFADSPSGNLYNKEGLPASSFRTDAWDK